MTNNPHAAKQSAQSVQKTYTPYQGQYFAHALTLDGQAENTISRLIASVVPHAKLYNYSEVANGGMFKTALPRLTLRMMSLADFAQTKGLGLALLQEI